MYLFVLMIVHCSARKERNEKSRYLILPAFIIPKKRRDISKKLKHYLEKKVNSLEQKNPL